MRKIIVARKVSKNILVVAGTLRMRSQMEKIRELGYECALIENIGTAMTSLRAGERVNVVVIDLMSERSAEKLLLWIKKNRPGVRVVCILNADLASFGSHAIALGATVLAESEIDQVSKVLFNLLGEQTR